MTWKTSCCVALWASACLDVAEDRARRDQEVGRAESAGIRVEVEDGLAAVHALSEGALELWANAPALRVRLELPAAAGPSFGVTVQNLLPDAEIAARDAAGGALTVTPGAGEIPTERRFSIDRGPGREIVIDIGTPDMKLEEPFEFIALADVQEAIDEVSDVFAKVNEQRGARFVMFSGDVTERGSAEELARFQREMRALRLPLYTTLGNHELGDSEVPYHDYFGRGSQSFRFRGVRFTFLDSASATLDPMVYEWLEGWLDSSRNENHLLFMHVPPLDPSGIRNGAFSNRAEAAKLLSMFGRGGVDTTFYGHIHSYYAFENAGIPAYISGGGGAIPERFDGVGRHFLLVRVDPGVAGTNVRLVRVD
jgi:Icc protein